MRRDVVLRVVVSLALATGVASEAAAQEQPRPSAADLARAHTLYEQGSGEYHAGRYDRAIELFLAAYALSLLPGILFNVAQAYRLKGECDRALEYYRRLLEEEPAVANRPEIEERIAEMEQCERLAPAPADTSATREPTPSTAPPPVAVTPASAGAPAVFAASEPDDEPRNRRILPIATAVVGAVGLVAGGVLYASARSKFYAVESECPCEPGSLSGWEAATTASYVLMGAGAVALGAGLIWWWKDSPRQGAPRVGVAPAMGGFRWVAEF